MKKTQARVGTRVQPRVHLLLSIWRTKTKKGVTMLILHLNLLQLEVAIIIQNRLNQLLILNLLILQLKEGQQGLGNNPCE